MSLGLYVDDGAMGGPLSAVAKEMVSIAKIIRIKTPAVLDMIIGIAFMEALAIYALVIAFFLQGKI